MSMMFESGDEAQRFLDWLGDDPRRDAAWAERKFSEWVDADRPGPQSTLSKSDLDHLLAGI